MPTLRVRCQELEAISGSVKAVFEGAIDHDTASTFQATLEREFQKGRLYFVIDFTQVTYVNSTGLGALVYFDDRVTAVSGGTALFGIHGKLLATFENLGLDTHFRICDSESEAVAALRKLIEAPDDADSASDIDDALQEMLAEVGGSFQRSSGGDSAADTAEIETVVSEGAQLAISSATLPGIDDGVLLRLAGNLDGTAITVLQRVVEEMAERGEARRFVIDMAELRYVSSTGMGLLVGLADSLESVGGRLALCRIPPKVLPAIRMLGLDLYFELDADEERAIECLGLPDVPSD